MRIIPKQTGNVVFAFPFLHDVKQQAEEFTKMPRVATNRTFNRPQLVRRTNTKYDKRERFKRNIGRRMDGIKRQLDMLENMAGTNYEYTSQEANAIARQLDQWVSIIKSHFLHTVKPRLPDFSLPQEDF